MKATSNFTDTVRATVFNISDENNAYVLGAGQSVWVNVPLGANRVSFAATNSFFCDFEKEAVVPGKHIIDGSAPMLNLNVVSLEGFSRFSIVAVEDNTTIVASFYGD